MFMFLQSEYQKSGYTAARIQPMFERKKRHDNVIHLEGACTSKGKKLR